MTEVASDTVSRDRAVEEGLLIARSAVTMSAKNSIIVGAIRDDQAFDPEVTSRVVADELIGYAAEQASEARRMVELAELAKNARGVAQERHDYRERDRPALILRSEIYAELSRFLRLLADDREGLAALAEAALSDAWTEIARAIEARLDSIQEVRDDADYALRRSQRLREFRRRDLAPLKRAARRADRRAR